MVALHPATHILSLTYAPKIEAVKAGTCRQTIRHYNPAKPKKVGDKLILHTWAGKPYRTPWDWRFEGQITEVIHLLDEKRTDRIKRLQRWTAKPWLFWSFDIEQFTYNRSAWGRA